MWYVVQTVTGEEDRVKALLEASAGDGVCRDCFAPLYEEVRRSHGENRIHFRRLFPGYLFVETGEAEAVFAALKSIPEFTRLLGGGGGGGRQGVHSGRGRGRGVPAEHP